MNIWDVASLVGLTVIAAVISWSTRGRQSHPAPRSCEEGHGQR